MTRERAQSFLEERHIENILQAYRAFDDSDGFARVATLEVVRRNDYSLNMPLYVRPTRSDANGSDDQPLEAVLAEWQASSRQLRASMDELFATLKEASLGR